MLFLVRFSRDICWDYIYEENTISIDSISVSGATGKGIGSNVVKWLGRYGFTQEGMSKMGCSTHNPLMLDTMIKALTDVVYTVSDISEDAHFLSKSKLKILCDIGGFFIDIEGSTDTFGGGRNKVVLDGNIVISSQWPLLPVGTNINEIDVSNRWIVILNGNPIGQVKYFLPSLEIAGTI